MKPDSFFGSVNCAVEGVIHAFRTQGHLRVHFVLALAAIALSLRLDLRIADLAVIIMLIGIVIVAELFNTALEAVMDFVHDGFHVQVKAVKDIAAGAVLFSAMTALCAGMLIFSGYLEPGVPAACTIRMSLSARAAVSLALTVFAVFTCKAVLRRGRPLAGGMPSGHAAISFSLFTSLAHATRDPVVLGIALVAAVVVSISRLVRRIHTGYEMLAGAVLGGSVTIAVFAACGR